MDAPVNTPAPACRTCDGRTIGWGKDRYGNPRRKCKACGATFGLIPERPLGSMHLSPEKASLCLSLLVEGSSIRSTERVSGVHRDTIMKLLRKVGGKCESLLNRLVRGVEVTDVEADELWCFVGCKEKTKQKIGKGRVDFAQIVKVFGGNGLDSERRYSPPTIISSEKTVICGEPEESKVCTSHVERHNLHIRMHMRRFTRLTNAFSRRRENLRAALALHFAAYNFTWMHKGIRMTPAMAAGITRKPWTVRDLLAV